MTKWWELFFPIVVRDERNRAGAKRADLCDADQTNASLEGRVSGMQTPHNPGAQRQVTGYPKGSVTQSSIGHWAPCKHRKNYYVGPVNGPV